DLRPPVAGPGAGQPGGGDLRRGPRPPAAPVRVRGAGGGAGRGGRLPARVRAGGLGGRPGDWQGTDQEKGKARKTWLSGPFAGLVGETGFEHATSTSRTGFLGVSGQWVTSQLIDFKECDALRYFAV